MNISTLLEMAADAAGDRVAVGSRHGGITCAELAARASAAAAWLGERGAERLVLVDVNSASVPIGLFGAAFAGVPFVPVNYRLADDTLRHVLEQAAPATVIAGPDGVADRIEGVSGLEVVTRDDFEALVSGGAERATAPFDPEAIAVLLFTSGTTGEPKAAVLQHGHLSSYVLGTVEFLGAGEDEATLVSVPPYHVAGLAAVLSSTYAARRIVYLAQFDPSAWVTAVADEGITHAMVVPTMLGRILDELGDDPSRLGSLRHLSYGGGRMPVPVIERAMRLLPEVDFVNAYGLTETSSTVAVLGPDDHRAAHAGDDAVRARLGSVGRPLPTVELSIRDPLGHELPSGTAGEIWVRGEQVSGTYLGRDSTLRDDGWFPTNDGGYLDDGGYLFVEGRLDDVIVRGAENLSPGEIEDVLVDHPSVAEAAVFGAPDDEWGEVPVAVVVPAADRTPEEAELKSWVRERLRSTRVPARIDVRDDLPYNDTGKLLRRVLKAEMSERRPVDG